MSKSNKKTPHKHISFPFINVNSYKITNCIVLKCLFCDFNLSIQQFYTPNEASIFYFSICRDPIFFF